VLGTREHRRVTWALVSQSAQVGAIDAGVLTLAFDNAALAGRFAAGNHAEHVALAVRETLGLHLRVESAVGPASASEPAPAESAVEGEVEVEDSRVVEDAQPEYAASAPGQLSGADAVAQMLGGTVVKE